MTALEKTIELNELYDLYGPLLTKRQNEVFEYYYQEDYSYQEIADILNISRAGVYDLLKRAVNLLKEMEKKLGFHNKYVIMIRRLSNLGINEVDELLKEFNQGGSHES